MAGSVDEVMNKRLLYIFDHTDWKSRLPLAAAAQEQGWDVTVGIVGHPPETRALENFKTVIIPCGEGKFTLLAMLQTITAMRKTICEVKADVVHTVTLKYAFLVGLAGLFQRRYHVVYTLAGLGFLFRCDRFKARLIRTLLCPFLKMVLRSPKAHIIFQNPDDEALMIKGGYINPAHSHLVISSGVDLEKFTAEPPPAKDAPLVLMPTRLVREKGIHVFVEAARLLKLRGINARFEIAGGETKHNPRAISRKEMQDITSDGSAHWLGRVDNMPSLLAKADIIVYPSYYGEGVPRVLLEAAAAGRPIITTDHPGCREAVDDGRNGFLIPIKDVNATATAIEMLLNDPDKRLKMGTESRKKAEDEFDVKRIVFQTLEVYKKAVSEITTA
jgi:glycosyltransferase involved in cell wall biosynthesis